MFILRAVKETDITRLYELSQLVTFINLPSDKEIIAKEVKRSITSFINPSPKLYENSYFFVCEDLTHNNIVGISMIHAQHGSMDSPHFFLQVGKEYKYSESTRTGFTHGTLKLGYDTNGPTEIGGLLLHPSNRSKEHKLGQQLSFVRFLFMALHREQFKPEIHTEFMPPLNKDGSSPLWEAIGRRFLNMDYQEADILSRSNKEFILNLYPSQIIYETLLPLSARNSIGKIGEETMPAKRMLEKIGLKYIHQIDPFDGGPHYRAKLEDITLVQNTFYGTLKILTKKDLLLKPRLLLIQIDRPNTPFAAFLVTGYLTKSAANEKSNNIINILDSEDLLPLNIRDGFKTHGIYLD